MQNSFAPLANIYQTQLEASRQFADAIFSGTEKIDHVLLDATHHAFTEQLSFAQSLIGVQDAQSIANMQSHYLSRRPERTMDYQRELIRIFSEMQNEIGKSMRHYMDQFGQGVLSTAESAREVPEKAGFNPVTGMFSAWESAFREATSFANKGMEAARNTFEDATNMAYSATEAADEMRAGMASTMASADKERKSSAAHQTHSKRHK